MVSAALACSVGCGKDSNDPQRLTRSSNQPAVVMVGETETAAGAIAEVEPNNEVAGAQELPIGTQDVHGTLEGSDDVDRFRFVAPSTGLLFLTASGGGEADLTVSLHDEAGKPLAKSDRGPAGTKEGLSGFGIEAGTTYQIVVTEFVGRKLRKAGGRKGPSGQYQLSWLMQGDDDVAEAGFEREPNEDLEGASEILIGEERIGFVGWSGDLDLWRLPITGFGEVTAGTQGATAKEALHMVVASPPGVALTFALLGPSGDVIAERSGGKGEEVALRNFLPQVGVDMYAIRIGGKPSNPEETYMLRVDAAEIAPGTEEEPNDTQAVATPLGGSDSTLHIARGELVLGDVDYFQLAPVAYDRILELRLSGPGSADLDISVVAESGAIIAEGLTTGAGLSETLSQVPVGQSLSPLLKVHAKSLKGPAAYELSLSLIRGTATPPPPPAAPIEPNNPLQQE